MSTSDFGSPELGDIRQSTVWGQMLELLHILYPIPRPFGKVCPLYCRSHVASNRCLHAAFQLRSPYRGFFRRCLPHLPEYPECPILDSSTLSPPGYPGLSLLSFIATALMSSIRPFQLGPLAPEIITRRRPYLTRRQSHMMEEASRRPSGVFDL